LTFSFCSLMTSESFLVFLPRGAEPLLLLPPPTTHFAVPLPLAPELGGAGGGNSISSS
jgi:hypothetical protein